MKFDELRSLAHSSRRMCKFVIGFSLCCLTLAVPASAAEQRPMTLQDCLQIALEHNLGLQVARIGPQIAEFNVSLSYANWEPSLSGSYTRSYSASPGGLDTQNRAYQGSETDSHSFSSSIGGLLPWGTRYSLGAGGSDAYGTSPGFQQIVMGGTTNFVAIRVPFENSSVRVGALTLSQPVLRNAWIDSSRLNVQVAKKNLQISELSLRQTMMSTVASVQNAYYDLIAAEENVKVQEKALQLAQQLLAENKKRVEVGALAPLDEKQAESQVASSQAALLAAKQALDTQENVLKGLLTDNYVEWHAASIVPSENLTAVPQAVSLQDSWANAMEMRPDLLQARHQLEIDNINLRYDRNQIFPQLDVNGTVGYIGSGQEFSDAFSQVSHRDNPFWSIGAVINIPLGNRAARENYKIQKARIKQQVLQVKSLEQSIMVSVDDALGQLQSSYERVDATKQARIYAEDALEAEQKKLENGKSTSFQVLQFQRDLTAARSQEIQALADYNKSIVQLYRQEGTILDKNKIQLQVK